MILEISQFTKDLIKFIKGKTVFNKEIRIQFLMYPIYIHNDEIILNRFYFIQHIRFKSLEKFDGFSIITKTENLKSLWHNNLEKYDTYLLESLLEFIKNNYIYNTIKIAFVSEYLNGGISIRDKREYNLDVNYLKNK